MHALGGSKHEQAGTARALASSGAPPAAPVPRLLAACMSGNAQITSCPETKRVGRSCVDPVGFTHAGSPLLRRACGSSGHGGHRLTQRQRNSARQGGAGKASASACPPAGRHGRKLRCGLSGGCVRSADGDGREREVARAQAAALAVAGARACLPSFALGARHGSQFGRQARLCGMR